MPNVTYSGTEGLKQTSGTGGFQVNDAAVLEDQDDVLALEIFTIQTNAETDAGDLAGVSVKITNLDDGDVHSFYMDRGAGDPGTGTGDQDVQVDLTGADATATADQVGAAIAAAITGVAGFTAAASAGSQTEGANTDLVTVTQHVAAASAASAVGDDQGVSGFTFAYTTAGGCSGGTNVIQAFGNTTITCGSNLADVIAVLGAPAGGAAAVGQKKLIVRSDANGGNVDISVTAHETSDPEVFRFDAADEYLLLMWTGTEWATITATATAP